jgi:hypothetical protein
MIPLSEPGLIQLIACTTKPSSYGWGFQHKTCPLQLSLIDGRGAIVADSHLK